MDDLMTPRDWEKSLSAKVRGHIQDLRSALRLAQEKLDLGTDIPDAAVFWRTFAGRTYDYHPLGGDMTTVSFRWPNGEEVAAMWRVYGREHVLELRAEGRIGNGLAVVPSSSNVVHVYPWRADSDRDLREKNPNA